MPKLLTPEERAELSRKLTYTSTYVAPVSGTLGEEYLHLAYALSQLHGCVRMTREAHGIHFYMASPRCLEQDGQLELTKMHLAVNAEKYFKNPRKDRVAQCMKTGTAYTISELLQMPPLEARGYADVKRVVQETEVNDAYMEEDGKGNLVPKSPGEVIPVFSLPADHPARIYLSRRGFCPYKLYAQFRLSFGVKERTDIFYRRMLNGFKISPQGRLIFFMDMGGVTKGWQARILELISNNTRFYYHPYQGQWVAVQTRENAESAWHVLPGWENWDPTKYFSAHGSRRNSLLMGYDAAVQSGIKDAKGRRYCFLVEGPLDAGRLGPPAIAHIGKHLSPAQAGQILNVFDRVIYVRDNDAGGDQAVRSVTEQFKDHADVALTFAKTPEFVKDVGELSQADADAFKQTLL